MKILYCEGCDGEISECKCNKPMLIEINSDKPICAMDLDELKEYKGNANRIYEKELIKEQTMCLGCWKLLSVNGNKWDSCNCEHPHIIKIRDSKMINYMSESELNIAIKKSRYERNIGY